MKIDEMLVRGRSAHHAALDRRFGGSHSLMGVDSVYVVTRADFLADPGLCLEYSFHVRPLHVLFDGSGDLVLMCAQRRKGPP